MSLALAFFARVPAWVWVAVVLVSWGLYGHYKANNLERERLETEVETNRLIVASETKKAERTKSIEEQYHKRIKDEKAVVAVLRADLDRLRRQTARSASAPDDAYAICGIDGERGRVLERLLQESAELAIEGAERVGRISAKTTALQNYIERVCLSK